MGIITNSYYNIICSHSGTSLDLTIVIFLEVRYGDTASFCGSFNNTKTLQGEKNMLQVYITSLEYLTTGRGIQW